MADWKDLFASKHFRRLENHGTHWAIAHVSFDGVSIGEICDKYLDRLIDTWESLLEDLDVYDEDRARLGR